MSSVNRGGSLTPAQIGLLVLVRICYSEYKRICMHANMQPRIYRGTCMCTCIRTCASCGRNQAEHCLFIPSCDKLSNADMTTEMIFRGIEQAIRLHQATACYVTEPYNQGSIYVVYRAMHQWSAYTCICHRFLHSIDTPYKSKLVHLTSQRRRRVLQQRQRLLLHHRRSRAARVADH